MKSKLSSPATRTGLMPAASPRRWVQYLLLFGTAALIINALAGDRGLTSLVKSQRDYDQIRTALVTIRNENSRLEAEVHRLQSDPQTIEEAARRDLGLARKDELLFIVKEAPPQP